MIKLREYQEKTVNDCLKALQSNKVVKSVVISPTAGGKSVIISELTKRLDDGNILIIQPSRELLSQNFSKFTNAGGQASIFSASFKSKEIGKVTYATDGSLKAEAFKDKNIKYILIDECHLKTQEGSKLNGFIKALGVTKILGFTASPVYLKADMSGAQLKMINRVKGKLFNDICHVTQIKELVNEGYWSKLIYDVKSVKTDSLQYNSNGSDFTKESLSSTYQDNELDKKIISAIESNKDRKSILIFVPSVEEAINLKGKIKGSEAVYSGMNDKDRDRILNDFKSLKLRIVINVNILAVGFDHAELSYIITARPTASIAMYYQQIGRGVRIHENKKNCLLTDLSGNVDRFGKLEGLTFQNIEGYGWGMFNEETLLSGVPLWEEDIPTITSLINKHSEKINTLTIKEITPNNIYRDEKIWFGKYKDKTCGYIIDKDPKYISWMLSDKNFKWNGDKMLKLKNVLLKLMRERFPNDSTIPEDIVVKSQTKTLQGQNSKELIESFTKKYSIGNLNELF